MKRVGVEFGDTGRHQNADAGDTILESISDCLQKTQFLRIQQSKLFSIIGDGSEEGRNDAEDEVQVVVFEEHGEIKTEFFALDRVLTSESADGKSHDAMAVTASWVRCMSEIGAALATPDPGLFKAMLVAGGADGASLNMGRVSGVVARMQSIVPHFLLRHCGGHNLELALHDASKDEELLQHFEGLLKRLYSTYRTAKRMAGLRGAEDMNTVLEDECPVVKYLGILEIRWLSSKHRAIKSALRNWASAIVDTHVNALPETGAAHHMGKPMEWFKGTKVNVTFPAGSRIMNRNGSLGAKRLNSVVKIGSVTGVSVADVGELEAGEFSGELYEVTYEDHDTAQFSKGEVCHLLDMDFTQQLEGLDDDGFYKNKHWGLHTELCDYTNLAVAHFLLDVDGIITVMSKVMQTNGLPLTDAQSCTRKTVTNLRVLRTEDGPNLTRFKSQCENLEDRQFESWLGFVLRGTERKAEFEAFRIRYLNKSITSIESRFEETEPVFLAVRVFDNRLWPLRPDDGGDELFGDEFGVDDVTVLFNHYCGLLVQLQLEGAQDKGSAKAALLSDWKVFKADIMGGDLGKDKASTYTFSNFWKDISLHHRARYPVLVWLVLITRLIPIGSAECERMFSLMNRLKTDLRNRIKTKRLDQWMRVNRLAPSVCDVSDAELDVWIDHWNNECDHGRYMSYFT